MSMKIKQTSICQNFCCKPSLQEKTYSNNTYICMPSVPYPISSVDNNVDKKNSPKYKLFSRERAKKEPPRVTNWLTLSSQPRYHQY